MSKSTHQKVTKSQYQNACETLQIIGPAVAQLKKVTKKMLPIGEAYAEVEGLLATFEKTLDKCQAVFDQIEKNRDEIGKDRISAISHRLAEIPRTIEGQKSIKASFLNAHESKLDDLKHKGYSPSQIKMIAPIPQAEIDQYDATINALEAEKAALTAFLEDCPAYNINLLAGTKFEVISTNEAA